MELLPAVPGMVSGAPEGNMGTPRWLFGRNMEDRESCGGDGAATAAAAGDMTLWFSGRVAGSLSGPPSPREAAVPIVWLCRVSFARGSGVDDARSTPDMLSMLSKDEEQDTDAGKLSSFPSILSDGVIFYRDLKGFSIDFRYDRVLLAQILGFGSYWRLNWCSMDSNDGLMETSVLWEVLRLTTALVSLPFFARTHSSHGLFWWAVVNDVLASCLRDFTIPSVYNFDLDSFVQIVLYPIKLSYKNKRVNVDDHVRSATTQKKMWCFWRARSYVQNFENPRLEFGDKKKRKMTL